MMSGNIKNYKGFHFSKINWHFEPQICLILDIETEPLGINCVVIAQCDWCSVPHVPQHPSLTRLNPCWWISYLGSRQKLCWSHFLSRTCLNTIWHCLQGLFSLKNLTDGTRLVRKTVAYIFPYSLLLALTGWLFYHSHLVCTVTYLSSRYPYQKWITSNRCDLKFSHFKCGRHDLPWCICPVAKGLKCISGKRILPILLTASKYSQRTDLWVHLLWLCHAFICIKIVMKCIWLCIKTIF